MSNSNYDYADPFFGCFEPELPAPRGIAAKWFFIKAQTGNCLPAAVLPFGAASACAYTGGYPSGYGPYWKNSDARPPRIMNPDAMEAMGISHFHQSGTGYIDEFYNFFTVTPAAGKVGKRGAYLPLSHEEAVPGYYSCMLGDVRCELTVSRMGAAERYTFPCDGENKLIFDPCLNGIVRDSQPDAPLGRVTAYSADDKGFSVTGEYTCVLHSAVKCSDCTSLEVLRDGRIVMTLSSRSITLYIGFSFASPERAAANLSDISKYPFDTVRKSAADEWDKALSAISIDADDITKKKFYSCLYQTLIKPVVLDEDSPHASGGKSVPLGDLCTMWDMYKSQLPLVMSLYPEIGEKLVTAFERSIDAFGSTPICLMYTRPDGRCSSQARSLACCSLYDAYVRGINGADAKRVLGIMRRELERDEYMAFFETGVLDDYPSHTIDLACASYAAHLTAADVGDGAVSRKYLGYSESFEKVYDKATGLCIAGGKFYEGAENNYSFRLLPDMKKRISLSPDYVKSLDEFFGYTSEDAVQFTDPKKRRILRKGLSRKGFEGFNNETDMETPYAYIYVNRLDRTCEIVRGGEKYMYSLSRGGLPGNNDSGGLTSVYILNALGLFPASGLPYCLPGSPAVNGACIHLFNGNTLNINVHGNSDKSIYTGSISFNGSPLTSPYIDVKELMKGGTLEFTMTDKADGTLRFAEI